MMTKDTGWRDVTLAYATGWAQIRRIGDRVFVRGILDTSQDATTSTPRVIINLPTGFFPDKQEFPHAFGKASEYIANYQINANDFRVSAIKVAASSAAGGLIINWYWFTTDAFPTD